MQQQPCLGECGRMVRQGRCGACYQKWRRAEHKKNPTRACEVADCARWTRAPNDRFCDMHRSRYRRAGDPGPAEPRFIRGEGGLSSSGYHVRQVDGNRVAVHRRIMEQIIGRELHPWENVHHVNGIRDDNRPENLELWVKPQPAGQRAYDLAVWVAENYPDLCAQAVSA